MEKSVGHSIGHVQIILVPLRRHFAPPGVPSWLRPWTQLKVITILLPPRKYQLTVALVVGFYQMF